MKLMGVCGCKHPSNLLWRSAKLRGAPRPDRPIALIETTRQHPDPDLGYSADTPRGCLCLDRRRLRAVLVNSGPLAGLASPDA